ncbi:hypothetical protein GTP91_33515, partial [Rugamonas sp. FT82W]
MSFKYQATSAALACAVVLMAGAGAAAQEAHVNSGPAPQVRAARGPPSHAYAAPSLPAAKASPC